MMDLNQMNIMDINQMNMMNLNQMNMMMDVTNQPEKGKEIMVEFKFQDNRVIHAKCFEKKSFYIQGIIKFK